MIPARCHFGVDASAHDVWNVGMAERDDRSGDEAPPVHEGVRSERERAGLTRSELAKLIGVTTMTVHRWENGQRKIPSLTLSVIANALGSTVARFYGETLAQRLLARRLLAAA